MGGRIALALTVTFPELFLSTVLESASPGLQTAAQRHQRQLWDERWAQAFAQNWPTVLERWYAQPLFTSLRSHPEFALMLQRRRQNNPAQLARSLRELGTGRQPSFWPHLASLSVPLLLMVGAWDLKFVALNQQMLRACPKATLVTIERAGHTVHVEQPEEFVRQLRFWIEH